MPELLAEPVTIPAMIFILVAIGKLAWNEFVKREVESPWVILSFLLGLAFSNWEGRALGTLDWITWGLTYGTAASGTQAWLKHASTAALRLTERIKNGPRAS